MPLNICHGLLIFNYMSPRTCSHIVDMHFKTPHSIIVPPSKCLDNSIKHYLTFSVILQSRYDYGCHQMFIILSFKFIVRVATMNYTNIGPHENECQYLQHS